MSNRQLKIIITGGGTGGHLFPGIAVAQEVLRRNPDAAIMFIGTGRPVDKNNLDKYPFDYKTINCSALKGGTIVDKLLTLAKLPLSLWEAITLLREFKPDFVFGVGGYVTGPVVVGAWLLRIPAFIHEQNSVPGLANRKLGPLVDKVFLSIPGSEEFFDKKKCILSGNPLRKEIIELSGEKETGRKASTLLVLGGSQGAHKINELVPEALEFIKGDLPADFKVIHQTGINDLEYVTKFYERSGMKAEVSPFITNMAEVYAETDIVISRAGATTLAELTALRKPSILIPYPFAADDHQSKNGECLVKAGAAVMYKEETLIIEELAQQILLMISDDAVRHKMGENAWTLAKVGAAESIVDECFSLI